MNKTYKTRNKDIDTKNVVILLDETTAMSYVSWRAWTRRRATGHR